MPFYKVDMCFIKVIEYARKVVEDGHITDSDIAKLLHDRFHCASIDDMMLGQLQTFINDIAEMAGIKPFLVDP